MNYGQSTTRERERISTSALLQELKALALSFSKAVPTAQFEYVDVTFNGTAHGDTEIRHSLTNIKDPDQVRVIPVEWRFSSLPLESPVIYRDVSATRKAWGPSYIVVRCNVASAQARLMLMVEPIR